MKGIVYKLSLFLVLSISKSAVREKDFRCSKWEATAVDQIRDSALARDSGGEGIRRMVFQNSRQGCIGYASRTDQ